MSEQWRGFLTGVHVVFFYIVGLIISIGFIWRMIKRFVEWIF